MSILNKVVDALLGRRYDERCREALSSLWELVKDDGCVMANPLRGQLEGIGWVVYVQCDGRDLEFRADTLLEAAECALRRVPVWQGATA